MLSVNEINLLQAQNEGLKKQNKELQHYLACMTEQRNKLITILEQIKEIAESVINRRPHSDNTVFEKMLNKLSEVKK